MIDRRSLLAGAASLLVARPGQSRIADADTRIHVIDFSNAPFLDRDEVPTDIDGANACTRPNHRFLDGLRENGIDTIIRYYSDQNNAGITCKNITRRERDLLHEHGFSVAMVYQYEGRSQNRYTGARAVQDAAFIAARMAVIGQPEGSAIYIGVDSDASLNTDAGVIEYFQVLNDVLGDRFEIGVYAAGARCRLLRDRLYARKGGDGRARPLATKYWVPEAPAWAGTLDFMNSGDWTFYQNKTDVAKSALTADMGQPVVIDTDMLNPAAGNSIGAFNSDGTIRIYLPARLDAIHAARAWVTDLTAHVRDRPGGTPVTHACVARTVHVLERQAEWALVDIDEDGIGEGYCRNADLAAFSQMPRYRSGCKQPKF
ncbi:DUF1906 domain-containing protein [Tropicimonas sp. TH_r6]|uniref:glycoside hydrolase domain-containing protein n=1 Tax=Tropicimonas sp. TH_r6 TaxID=3082085 RepID=UPI0029543773|nr:glycoside hydrolase domain-containing protein [Tropicimonas sp. TH_r6]MDV7141971.1 DUF1906 domain-containing protein [Tropicimonas sp. TH_r6]